LATEEVAKYEAEHQELGNIEDLTEKKRDLQAGMNVNKAKLAEIQVHSAPSRILYYSTADLYISCSKMKGKWILA
jgi:hypothetical protein